MRVVMGLVCLLLTTAAQAPASVVLEDGAGWVEVVQAGGSRGLGILPGEPLNGALRTGADSRAVLTTDDGAKLALGAASQVEVTPGARTRVDLRAGRIVAELAPGAHPLDIHAGEDPVVIAGQAGKFEVALADDGALQIHSTTGALSVTRDGKKATVASGQSLALGTHEAVPASAEPVAAAEPVAPAPVEKPVAAAEPAPAEKPIPGKKVALVTPPPAPVAAPAKPAPVPAPAEPPKLDVSWPKGSIAASVVTLKGKVTPGASVKVNDVSARVRKNGSFTAVLQLPEGESAVSVTATGADGQATTAEGKVTLATPPPAKPAVAAPAGSDEPSAASDGPSAASDDEAPKTEKSKKKGSKPKVQEEEAGWE